MRFERDTQPGKQLAPVSRRRGKDQGFVFQKESFDTGKPKYYHARHMPGEIMIDSLKFAQRGEHLAGRVSVASLTRLESALFSAEGELEYAIDGVLQPDGKPALQGIIRGALQLICQRCLGPFPFCLNLVHRYALVATEQELPDLASEAGDIDALVALPKFDVLALLEDEVILSLPLAPHHDYACAAQAGIGAGGRRAGAFDTLATIKKH
jgi:uncharacterized protein